jgi:hypothetical protein
MKRHAIGRARTLLAALALIITPSLSVKAQSSPGDLSRPHAGLEGTTNCTKCHEVGAEISGAKCLTCHREIERTIAGGHGFHASTSSQKCVACHKEHLGRDARTVATARKDFDHARTGFALTGRHGSLQCGSEWSPSTHFSSSSSS